MIKAILIFNNHGKPRLSKFYEHYVSNNSLLYVIKKVFDALILAKPFLCNCLIIKATG